MTSKEDRNAEGALLWFDPLSAKFLRFLIVRESSGVKMPGNPFQPLNTDKSPEFGRVFGGLGWTGHRFSCNRPEPPVCDSVTKRDWLYQQASWPLQQLLIQGKLIWNDFATPFGSAARIFWKCHCTFFTFFFLFFLSHPDAALINFSFKFFQVPAAAWLSSILNRENCRIPKSRNGRMKQNTGLRHEVKEHLGGEMNVMSTFSHFKELSAQTRLA